MGGFSSGSMSSFRLVFDWGRFVVDWGWWGCKKIFAVGRRAGYLRSNCIPGGKRPERVPVCRDAAFGCSSDSTVNELFSLRSDKCFCDHLRGPSGSVATTGVTSLRNNVTTVLASDNRTTGFFTLFGVYRANDRVITSSTVCNNACGLLNIAVGGVNVSIAFISRSLPRRRLTGTFEPGAETVFNRAVAGPAISILSVRGFTELTRSRNIPLVISGAFTAPMGYRPVG